MNNKNICVFCSSSNTLANEYYADAEILGELLAKNGFNLVYGGSNVGTMYSVAKTAKQNGSKIYGVMTESQLGRSGEDVIVAQINIVSGGVADDAGIIGYNLQRKLWLAQCLESLVGGLLALEFLLALEGGDGAVLR